MKKVLIFAGRYLPGHKDGGPLRTLINLTDALYKEYDFYIACYDRDHGDTKPYQNIEYNTWNQVGNAKVWYIPEGKFTKKTILKLSKDKDIIYLTSFFEQYGYNTLILKKQKKINIPIALASMGVFSQDAMNRKALKKRIFIKVCNTFKLFKNITWSVTSEIEAKDVKRIIGNDVKYVVAEDLPRTNVPGRTRKFGTTLKIVFLSRICEHKNLSIVIDAVNALKKNENIELYIYGPIEEKKYWEKCLMKLKNVKYKWKYGGDVPSEKVQDILSKYDIFILPSKSENYGHAIFEAMSVGCIPIISDRTPWKELNEKKLGFEIPLDVEKFTQKINIILNMSLEEREKMSKRAIDYANYKVRIALKNTGYRNIFK